MLCLEWKEEEEGIVFPLYGWLEKSENKANEEKCVIAQWGD